MANALTVLRERLARFERWVLVAGAIGGVLLIVYGFQGVQFYFSSSELGSSSSELDKLNEQIREHGNPALDPLKAALDERKRLLEDWASIFSLEGQTISITDDRGTTSTALVNPSFLGEEGSWLILNITPETEYAFTVEHTGNVRHYKLGADPPGLSIWHMGLSYHGDSPQEWRVSALADEKVSLELTTHVVNEGAFQATSVSLTLSDLETGSVLFGPTSTSLTLDVPKLVTYQNTSTDRDLKVRLEPDGHFKLRKLGGDTRLYLLPCPTGSGRPDPGGFSCAIGIFEADNTHSWALSWTEAALPEDGGPLRLRFVAAEGDYDQSTTISETDRLLEMVDSIASKFKPVELAAMVLESEAVEIGELLVYRTLTVTISLSGDTHNEIFEFLDILHKAMPFVEISDTKLAGFGKQPSARVELIFHLAPRPVPEEG